MSGVTSDVVYGVGTHGAYFLRRWTKCFPDVFKDVHGTFHD